MIITLKIDWLTIALVTASVVTIMGAYYALFYEEDTDDKGTEG